MNEVYRSESGARLLRDRYLSALEQWPVPNDQLHIPTPEGDTFVIASGRATAPPLVLLHGSGSNATQWMDRISDLATDFRVYAVDIVGEPGLSAPSRPPLESDRYAVWLDAVLDFLRLDRVPIMAVSLGGWLAVDYATRRPGRVEQLALSCPAGIGRQKKGSLLKAVLLNAFGQWGRRKSVAMMLGPGLSTMEPAAVAAVVDEVLLVARNVRYRSGAVPIFDDDTLRQLTMPIHVLVGEADVMFDSHETEHRLATTVSHAQVHLLPDVGHFIPARTTDELHFLTSAR